MIYSQYAVGWFALASLLIRRALAFQEETRTNEWLRLEWCVAQNDPQYIGCHTIIIVFGLMASFLLLMSCPWAFRGKFNKPRTTIYVMC